VQLRLFDYRFVERLKGAQADMEGDKRLFGAGLAAAGQDFGGEVESGGRRGDGTVLAGIDGLVAIAVGGRIGALDVGREGDVAEALEGGIEIRVAVKPDGALAELAPGNNLAFEALIEPDAFADRQFAAGMDERLPIAAVRGNAAQQKDFDRAAQVFAELGVVLADGEGVDSGAVAEEARGKDAGIVDHQAIAGVQVLREVAENAIFPSARLAVDDEHTGGGAVGEGFLGNAFFGQVVIEISQLHATFTVAETGPMGPPSA
jgi:hypothetical protein